MATHLAALICLWFQLVLLLWSRCNEPEEEGLSCARHIFFQRQKKIFDSSGQSSGAFFILVFVNYWARGDVLINTGEWSWRVINNSMEWWIKELLDKLGICLAENWFLLFLINFKGKYLIMNISIKNISLGMSQAAFALAWLISTCIVNWDTFNQLYFTD